MLTEEAFALLTDLVEATRRQPHGERAPFLMQAVVGSYNYMIRHPGIPHDHLGAYPGDVDVLVRAGMLLSRQEQRHFVINVSPEGFEYYANHHQAEPSTVSVVEITVRKFLDSEAFRRLHAGAFGKLSEARALLWRADGNTQLTTIGHLCREAMQIFAQELVDRCKPPNVSNNPTATVDRIRCVLQARLFSGAKRDFFDALLAYWGTASDLVQRQEHGALKEGDPLVWEDERLVVFQSMNVMYELSRLLDK